MNAWEESNLKFKFLTKVVDMCRYIGELDSDSLSSQILSDNKNTKISILYEHQIWYSRDSLIVNLKSCKIEISLSEQYYWQISMFCK